jgi:amino acid permease
MVVSTLFYILLILVLGTLTFSSAESLNSKLHNPSLRKTVTVLLLVPLGLQVANIGETVVGQVIARVILIFMM